MAKNKVNSEGIVLEIPIKFSMITKIEYEQKFGEHAEMEIHGILDADEKVKQAYALNMEDAILLKQKDKILFSGVPSYVSVSHEGNLTKVIVKGNSRSILLDLQRKKRSFQKKQSYKALMENVLGNEGLLFLQKGLSEKQKEQMVMQYKETDWEFIKRMASHLHAPICPNIGIEKTGIYIGYPKGKELEESVSVFKMKKDISEYLRYQEQNSSTTDKEFITMTIRSLERYDIGDTLSYDGYEFMVCSVQMKYEDGVFQYTYQLRNKNGFKWRKKYHADIAGSTVNGKILKVNRDKVKLHLCIDKEQPVGEALWFPVAIGYTAEGSTGLYTAMEEGESVKLFFPKADEKNAYVRLVNKGDSDTSKHFRDPVTKCYGTPYGSFMQTGKKGILISQVKDKIFVKMNEDDGIEFHSTEKMDIYTEKKLDVDCKTLKIKSNDKIIIHTTGSNIIVDETVHMKTKG